MVKAGAPLMSWIFTAIAALVFILMLVFSFVRFRRRRQQKRTRELEYMARLKLILPGCSYSDGKKTLARKIMTNTHAVSIAEVCLVPVECSYSPLQESQPLSTHSLENYSPLAATPGRAVIPQRSHPHLTGILTSQNSNDTTTDDEKPLVRTNGRFPGELEIHSTFIQEDAPTNATKQVQQSKRRMKSRSQRGNHHLASDKMSPDFVGQEKQNYIVYSPMSVDKRRQSDPFVQSNLACEDIAASTSAPSVSISNYYTETDFTPSEVKSKHRKGHKAGHKAERRAKKNKKLAAGQHRARSLPQLDNVYYANVIDDSLSTQADPHDPMNETLATVTDHDASRGINKVFIKRKPFVPRGTKTRSDPAIQLSSFPLISQSEESNEQHQSFNSEYM